MLFDDCSDPSRAESEALSQHCFDCCDAPSASALGRCCRKRAIMQRIEIRLIHFSRGLESKDEAEDRRGEPRLAALSRGRPCKWVSPAALSRDHFGYAGG